VCSESEFREWPQNEHGYPPSNSRHHYSFNAKILIQAETSNRARVCGVLSQSHTNKHMQLFALAHSLCTTMSTTHGKRFSSTPSSTTTSKHLANAMRPSVVIQAMCLCSRIPRFWFRTFTLSLARVAADNSIHDDNAES
jgi:DMSO reductase anchor subunit